MRNKTIEQRLSEIEPSIDKARLARMLYILEMLVVCRAGNRTDWREWANSLASHAESYTQTELTTE